MSILRTAIYVDPPHTSLVPQTIPTIFSSGIPNPPQMIAGLRPRHCSWARVRCNCLPQQHAQLRRLLLSFPKRKLRRQVCTNCVIHETYVSQRLTNLCFVPNPICHSPTGGRPYGHDAGPSPQFHLIMLLLFLLLCYHSV